MLNTVSNQPKNISKEIKNTNVYLTKYKNLKFKTTKTNLKTHKTQKNHQILKMTICCKK